MNDVLLIEKINNSGYTRKGIANKMGITPNSLKNKLSGRSYFNYLEIVELTRILGLTQQDYLDIFLPNEFTNREQKG